MVPEKRIVKRVKAYDPNLFIKWNNQEEFFELWMKHWQGGQVKITPITESIYLSGAPRAYVPLDERLLVWSYEADSAKRSKHDYISMYSEFDEVRKNIARANRDNNKYAAKEVWHGANNFFTTKSKPKNGPPRFLPDRDPKKFVRPNSKSRSSSRIFQRSKQNAYKYNYGG